MIEIPIAASLMIVAWLLGLTLGYVLGLRYARRREGGTRDRLMAPWRNVK